MSWSKQQVLEFLEERPRIGRLATVTAGGDPRVVPVWFRIRDGKVLVHTGTRMAKARNVQATGRYSLAVDDDTWPYRGVAIWGDAQRRDADEAVADLQAFMTDIAVSYLGTDAGIPMGASLYDPSWPHSLLELSVDGWLGFDYSK